MLRTTGIVVAAFFLLTSIGLGQDNRFDVSLGGGAVIPNQPSGNGTTLTPTKSGAVLVTGRYRFSERSSVELNYGHTSDSQIYSTPPLTYRIQNTISEYSGAYVFSFHQSARLEPFVFVGAAAVIFYPGYSSNTVNDVLTNIPASQQTKPAFLYGGGLDYRIFSQRALDSQIESHQPSGPAAPVPRASLQGPGLQSAEPVHRRQRAHGGADHRNRGEVLENAATDLHGSKA